MTFALGNRIVVLIIGNLYTLSLILLFLLGLSITREIETRLILLESQDFKDSVFLFSDI